MIKHIIGILFLLLFSGCVGQSKYTPVSYYDFGQPELSKIELNVDTFTVEGPYQERFIYRVDGNRLDKDEYKRWAQAPDLLLAHYFKQSFKPGSLFYLSGEILTVEHDLVDNEAKFKIIYSITKEGRSIKAATFQKSFPTDGTTESFVTQISKAVSELNTEVSNLVTQLK